MSLNIGGYSRACPLGTPADKRGVTHRPTSRKGYQGKLGKILQSVSSRPTSLQDGDSTQVAKVQYQRDVYKIN
eukprot:8826304-Pyramimonas_sp.AAC.1